MQWELVVALVIAVPVILVPVAFVWYLSIGGIYRTIKEARRSKATREVPAGEVRLASRAIS